jgi:hypothetical protein
MFDRIWWIIWTECLIEFDELFGQNVWSNLMNYLDRMFDRIRFIYLDRMFDQNR